MTEGMTCRPLERRVCGEKSFGISRLVLGVGLLLMAACTGRSADLAQAASRAGLNVILGA